MIILKTEPEIALMRVAGRILADLLTELAQEVRPGITTGELEALADRRIREANCSPTFRGQPGMVSHAPPYPAATCISINEEVIHGIPGPRVLQDGDLVSIDCGVTWKGWIADAALSVVAGEPSPEISRLVRTTRRSLEEAVAKARPGARLGDVSFAVQQWAMAEGLGVVREFCGHGVGRSLHEDPPIPNYGSPGTGPVLRPGMTLAVEPMFTLGNPEVRVQKDGWTVVTRDRKPAAHFEYTLLVTTDGCEVLTPWRLPPTQEPVGTFPVPPGSSTPPTPPGR